MTSQFLAGKSELRAAYPNEMEGRKLCKGAVVERDQEIKIGPCDCEAPVRHSSLLATIIGIKCPIKHREVTWNDKCLHLLTSDPSHLPPGVLGCPATGPPQGGGTTEGAYGDRLSRQCTGCFNDDP